MSRKQFVLIEWTILLVIIVGLIVGGICLVRRHAGKTDRKDLQQSEKYSAASEKDDKDTCTFSFAGDCTIGSLLEWQGSLDMDFQSVVREDYAYPFSGVREIFGRDDFTVVNLEGTFTDSEDAVEKPYRFKADPVYVNVLQEGGVDAVSLANNHSGDLGAEGKKDTIAALDTAGILHSDP